jgi:predicted Fe-Mo cluster-binding NifX family protein
MVIRKVAFPTVANTDNPQMSGHFGHAAGFTVVELNMDSKSIIKTQFFENPPHEQGGCMRPVTALKSIDVTDIVVGGIGQRPFLGFGQVGISVHKGIEGSVSQNITAFMEGRLQSLSKSSCGSHAAGETCNH